MERSKTGWIAAREPEKRAADTRIFHNPICEKWDFPLDEVIGCDAKLSKVQHDPLSRAVECDLECGGLPPLWPRRAG
jgi:hypothetical protein